MKGAKKIKSLGNSFMKSDKLLATFLRSALSSQAASICDIAASIALVWIGLSDWLATPIGAIVGGVVNCVINYKFTFHADGVSKRAVAVKYVMVWLGSVALNTVGTAWLTAAFDKWRLLEYIGFTNVGSFAAARIIVSLLVGWFWNFVMQKYFVYKPVKFDGYVIKMWDKFSKKNK